MYERIMSSNPSESSPGKVPSTLLELIDSPEWEQMTNPVGRLDLVMQLSDRMRLSKRFVPPTPDEVADYAGPRGLMIDQDKFCDFYQSKGWKVGSSPMKDWRASVRNWCRERSGDRWANVPIRKSPPKSDPESMY
jgi:hypothetical protein